MHSTASAQVRDSARTAARDTLLHRDTLSRRDTSGKAAVAPRDTSKAPRDTIKAPLTHAEAPVLADQTGSFVLDRKDIFATGALTVQDLLDRIPGVTGLQSLWLSQPIIASFLGDPGRVRVFLDGIELQDLDPRMRGLVDLSQIPLWALDDIRVERGASEIRIYMRTWRVDRTTPYTRTDVYTGDQGTNLYRGLFGRRYDHGESLQLAGQQYNTGLGRLNFSSDALSVLARVGIARNRWSVDALLLRGDRNRGLAATLTESDSIPATSSTSTQEYLRLGWGDSEHGPWFQALANASRYAFGGQSASASAPDSLSRDTTRSSNQYLLAGGYVRGPWHASVMQRYIVGDSRRVATPSVRVGFDARMLAVTLLADGRGLDSTRRLEASAIARPLSFIFLGGAVGTERPRMPSDSSPVANFVRAEAGLRIRDTWISGGMLRRDASRLVAPTILISDALTVMSPPVSGVFATIRGRVWKAVYADLMGVQWNDSSELYHPKYQTRSELYVSTSMLDRFPSNNFHVLASLVHEYRSTSFWPDSSGLLRVGGYRTVSTMIQFRIVRAEVFWNLRNLLGAKYEQVPGYRRPGVTNIYGIRWEFWN